METNLNFVLLAQFYIPMCTKSLLAWNKDEALKYLEKILQLMYAYTCWSTYIHKQKKVNTSQTQPYFDPMKESLFDILCILEL